MSKWLPARAARRRCWRRATTTSSRPRPRPRSARRPRAGPGTGRRRARRRWRSGSSARPRSARAASRSACSRSLVPSRPMPVSSFTCTRGAAARPPRRSRPPRRPPRRAPRRSSARRQRAHHEDRRVDAVLAQRRAPRPRWPRPARSAPPAQRRPRRLAGAVPVAVGLDHGAERLRQPGAVALDRAEVDGGERALDGLTPPGRRARPARVTTPTRRPSSTTGSRLCPDSWMIRAASRTRRVRARPCRGSRVIMSSALEANALRSRFSKRPSGSRKTVPPNRLM